MRVFVKNLRGKALMPCSSCKARKLLKNKQAKIIDYKSFTIQLLVATGESVQECNVGIDTGSKHIGVAITSNDKVLVKGEIELRQDVKSNLDTRIIYRRSRRCRKTRYRKARFDNRKRNKEWLPPSIQSKLDIEFRMIDKFVSLVPNPKLFIEVGKFDTAKMIDPDIEGIEYQQGQTYGYYDTRYYVFARDNYTCQVCHKSGILQTHHIVYKSNGGTDRADNLITVCNKCHSYENHQKGGILYKWQQEHKKVKQYKEPPFMNIVRKRVFSKYPKAHITYGSITTPKRKELGLSKTHYNDAIVISGIKQINQDESEYFIFQQFRKKKRSLHEATARKGRKTPNREAKRNSKNTKEAYGFYLNDKVSVNGEMGYVVGFCKDGCYVKNIDDEYIVLEGKTYKQISPKQINFISHNNNWRYEIHPTT